MNLARRIAEYLRAGVQWRRACAYFLMGAFIVGSSVGAGQVYGPAGWITAGVTCGLVGYLLGAD